MKYSLKTIIFLDIKINGTNIATLVCRKPTNTNLFSNFNAIYPTKWKSDLIFCLLNCAKRI